MSKRRGTQHRRANRRAHSTAEDAGATPEGFVIWTGADGVDTLVYDPELRAAMRHDCPICNGEQ